MLGCSCLLRHALARWQPIEWTFCGTLVTTPADSVTRLTSLMKAVALR